MRTLITGDCLDLLRKRASAGAPVFDVILTDPPGAKNMAEWDSKRGGRDEWISWLAQRLRAARACARPGAWLCCWAHPSTTGWTQRSIDIARHVSRHRDFVERIDATKPREHLRRKLTALQLDRVLGDTSIGIC